MFEIYTEDYFMEQAREMGDALGVDTREGSVYMDACSGHILRAAKFYNDLRIVFDMLSDDTCTGDVLAEKAGQHQIYRKEATPAYYNVELVGVPVAELVGNRFMTDGFYFILTAYDNGYYLQAEVAGSAVNYILADQTLIPVKNIQGLIAATIGPLYVAGADQESDGSLRQRYLDVLMAPAENGNKQQYKIWCNNYDGVGRAIITSLAFGPNTVKAVIIGSDGEVPTDALVEHIQNDIDPGSQGLGEGKAPIGCHFYAVAAEAFEINVSFEAELTQGYLKEEVNDTVWKTLKEYLKEVALNTPDGQMMIVQYVKIIGILANISGIRDFKNLKINGGSENIIVVEGRVGMLKEVIIKDVGV